MAHVPKYVVEDGNNGDSERASGRGAEPAGRMGVPDGHSERRDPVLAAAAIGRILDAIKPTLPITVADAEAIYGLVRELAPQPFLLDVQCYRKGICVQIFIHDGCGLKKLFVRELFAVNHESLDAP